MALLYSLGDVMAYLIRVDSDQIKDCSVPSNFKLLMNKNNSVNWDVLNYMISILKSGLALSTVNLYGCQLCDFFSQVEVDAKNLHQLDYAYLEEYKKSIKARNEEETNYAPNILRTVLSFLYWMECEGHVVNLIGSSRRHKIYITFDDKGKMLSPLSKSHKKTSKRKLPKLSWINAVKKHGLINSDLALRLELMIDFCNTTSARSMEVCALEIKNLPCRSEVEEALVNGVPVDVLLVKTKGGRARRVKSPPILISKIHDWIDYVRPDLVAVAKKNANKKLASFIEPAEVFLSKKTGRKLDPRTFSNQVRNGFLKGVMAGDIPSSADVWAQGLRHYFVNNELKERKAAGQKGAEQVVIKQTGHSSLQSMEVYVHDSEW